VFSIQYGETWFYRNFEVEIPWRLSDASAVNRRREQRKLNSFNCIICGDRNWVGAHVCFSCTRPHFYAEHLPKWLEYNPNWRSCCIDAPQDAMLRMMRNVLHEARAVKSQIIYAVFNVKPPAPEVLKKRQENIRGNPGTIAAQYDSSQDRKLRSLVKLGVVQYTDVRDRITRNAQYRTLTANYLVNVDCYYNPAQYLLSKYCVFALETARQLGEMPRAEPSRDVPLPQFDDIWIQCTWIDVHFAMFDCADVCCRSIGGDVTSFCYPFSLNWLPIILLLFHQRGMSVSAAVPSAGIHLTLLLLFHQWGIVGSHQTHRSGFMICVLVCRVILRDVMWSQIVLIVVPVTYRISLTCSNLLVSLC